jgi:hypothetical protein
MASTSTVKAFSRTVGATAERLQNTAASYRYVQNCIILAPSSNSGTVYVGDSTVDSTNGFPLAAGQSVSIGDLLSSDDRQEFDIYEIWIVGSGAGQVVKVLHNQNVNS